MINQSIKCATITVDHLESLVTFFASANKRDQRCTVFILNLVTPLLRILPLSGSGDGLTLLLLEGGSGVVPLLLLNGGNIGCRHRSIWCQSSCRVEVVAGRTPAACLEDGASVIWSVRVRTE